MNDELKYRLPAEWEPQSGVQLTWPHRDTDWAPILDDVLTVYQQMAREISRRERLLIVAGNASERCNPDLVGDASKRCISSVTCPTNDTWARDHGFITLIDDSSIDDLRFGCASSPQDYQIENRKSPNRKLLDFCFNGWGEKFPAELDNAINRHLYDMGAVHGEYADHLDFVLEGGSIESDGKGTIFTTSQCLLAPHRNQPLIRDEIEQRLKDYLCADRVLWIDHGSLAGDDTDGHIDTLARFCSPDTIAYVAPPEDENDEDYYDFCMMEDELKAFRTKDGEPYNLVPLPYLSYELDGEPQPATYANFLIMNKAVLVPVYGLPTDEAALSAIGDAFPDREVVGIDCRPLVQQHGSLHCVTMQYPAGFFLPTRK